MKLYSLTFPLLSLFSLFLTLVYNNIIYKTVEQKCDFHPIKMMVLLKNAHQMMVSYTFPVALIRTKKDIKQIQRTAKCYSFVIIHLNSFVCYVLWMYLIVNGHVNSRVRNRDNLRWIKYCKCYCVLTNKYVRKCRV